MVGLAGFAGEIDLWGRGAAFVEHESIADFLLPGLHRGGEARDVGGVGGVVVDGAHQCRLLHGSRLGVTE